MPFSRLVLDLETPALPLGPAGAPQQSGLGRKEGRREESRPTAPPSNQNTPEF